MNAGTIGIIQKMPPRMNSDGAFNAPKIPPTDMNANASENARVA